MFAFKNKYFLIIESIKDLNLRNIKRLNKFNIIYRNKNKENIEDLRKFRNLCKVKLIRFFVANDVNLAVKIKADGLYLSSYNKSFKGLFLKSKLIIIGSAHNSREIVLKIKQGCNYILLSKLFVVDYDRNSQTLGILKFNNYTLLFNKIIPLGGIKISNINKLKSIRSHGFAILSEIKKKPAKIISRLFWINPNLD